MFTMGHNGWIKYGWGPDLLDEWFSGADLIIDFTSSTTSGVNLLEAGINCARTIAENNIGPYTIMASGGVDSQAVIYAWHMSGIPFNVVSVKYISNGKCFNDHDLLTLKEFTDICNIPVVYKEFDIIKFLETDLPTLSKITDCHSPHLCTYMRMSELIEKGTIIFSGNFLEKDIELPSHIQVRSSLNYSILGMDRYSKLIAGSDRTIIPFFLNYTPDLALTSLKSPIIHKTEILKAAGYPVITQNSEILRKQKFTGFEYVKIYYDSFVDRITTKDKLKAMNKPSKRVFDMLFRYSLEDHRMVNDGTRVINKINIL
jgi:hypothetical protein